MDSILIPPHGVVKRIFLPVEVFALIGNKHENLPARWRDGVRLAVLHNSQDFLRLACDEVCVAEKQKYFVGLEPACLTEVLHFCVPKESLHNKNYSA